MCGHSEISALTGKIVKGDDDSVIKELFLLFSHTTDFEDFSILATNSNDFRVTLMESLLINRDCNQYIFHNFFSYSIYKKLNAHIAFNFQFTI